MTEWPPWGFRRSYLLELVEWVSIPHFVYRVTSLRLSTLLPHSNLFTDWQSHNLSTDWPAWGCRRFDLFELVSWVSISQFVDQMTSLRSSPFFAYPIISLEVPALKYVDRVTSLRSSPFFTYLIVAPEGPALNWSTEWLTWGRRHSLPTLSSLLRAPLSICRPSDQPEVVDVRTYSIFSSEDPSLNISTVWRPSLSLSSERPASKDYVSQFWSPHSILPTDHVQLVY